MRIGFANGCFDGLHPGHRFFLDYARDYCDWFIVAVNSNKSIRQLKGPDRPIRDIATRIRDLQMTGVADAIVPFNGDPLPLLQQIAPDFLIRGEDQSAEGFELAGRLVRVPRLQGYSTTELEGRHVATLDREGSKRKFVVVQDHRKGNAHAPE